MTKPTPDPTKPLPQPTCLGMTPPAPLCDIGADLQTDAAVRKAIDAEAAADHLLVPEKPKKQSVPPRGD